MPGNGRGGGLRAGLISCLVLAACEIPKEVNPVAIYRQLSGEADAGRPPPPGLDQPFPNLASVPPRPERPTAEAREAISAALREDRAQSRGALVLRTLPGTTAPGRAPGEPAMAGAPPPRAALTAAPRIPWADSAAPQPGATLPAGAAPSPGPAPPAAPAMPEAAPAPPPPDLLGIPPPPSPDLLAPPRPR